MITTGKIERTIFKVRFNLYLFGLCNFSIKFVFELLGNFNNPIKSKYKIFKNTYYRLNLNTYLIRIKSYCE